MTVNASVEHQRRMTVSPAANQVAEMTGRSTRIVRRGGAMAYEKRGKGDGFESTNIQVGCSCGMFVWDVRVGCVNLVGFGHIAALRYRSPASYPSH